METRQTYCRICEALCGIEVDVDGGRVVAVRPDKLHPISKGFCCVKGMRMLDLHRDPDRLRHPLKRVGNGEFLEISWRRAFSEIAEKFRQLRKKHGPHSIAFYTGNPVTFSYSHLLFSQAFATGLGSRNLYNASSQDANNKLVVAKELYGSSAIHPIPDLERMKYFLCIGSNPAISGASFVHMPRAVERLSAIKKGGGKVVMVGPRRTETSHATGTEHIFIRPDTDVFFLAALIHVFERESWIWWEGVKNSANGVDELLEIVRPFPPERAAKVTGIDAKTIEEVAENLHSADGAGVYCSTGVNQGTAGTLAYWFVNALNLISKNLDRAGGMLVPTGHFDLPRLAQRLKLEDIVHRSRVGGFESELGALPGAILADEIMTPGDDKVRALFVTAGNPVLSFPNSTHITRALKELELLVCVDIYRNETGELADYVLPATDFFQRDDYPLPLLGLQPKPHVQYTESVAQPLGEERQEWEIFLELARACEVPLFDNRWLDITVRAAQAAEKLPWIGKHLQFHPRRLLELLFLRNPITLAALRQTPRGLQLPPNEPGSFLGKRVLTADGRINMAPRTFVREATHLWKVWEEKLEQIRDEDILLLVTKRERRHHNSWMHNISAFVSGDNNTNYAYMNPVDAEKHGIKEGDRINVFNRWGSITLPTRLTEDVLAGVIAIPHGWGHGQAKGLRVANKTSGVNVNELAPDGPENTEWLAGLSQLTGIPVQVEMG